MKRIALYLGIAVTLVASCSTQENDFQTLQSDDVEFYASFEHPADEGTRVYANEDLLLRWTADDRVSIFNKTTYNQEYKFLGETGDNAGGFNKVDNAEFVTGNAISHVVSVYPYQASTKISEEEVITVTLPEEQTYAESTFGLGANTMISVSEDNVLQYKNVGGYLMLKLYGEGVSVSSITLNGNNGEKLAGKASVSMPLDGVPTTEMADNATSEITLTCPEPVQLGSTAEESTLFWFVVPPTTFSNGFTITVNQSTGGVFEKSTYKSITIERNKLTKMSPIEVGVWANLPVPEAVDLGLPSGLKWASFNLGASSPEGYGDYYAWGETAPYYSSKDPLTWREGKENGYVWSCYKWCMDDYFSLTKYCYNSSYGYNGFTDNKTVLDPEDDAAKANLKGKWRMPTDAEWNELMENCTWTHIIQNGINGKLVTASNGNSIFLPAAGGYVGTSLSNEGYFGRYWSSSLYLMYPLPAYELFFMNSTMELSAPHRSFGLSVRPVYGDPSIIPVESVSLDKTELKFVVGNSSVLVATVHPTYATDKSVSWSSSNASVATVSSSGVVTGVATGSAIITVTTSDGGKTAACSVTITEATVPVPEVIDLGLSVKWALFNLGASSPEEFGDYYAWGETEPNYSSQDPLIWKEGKENGYDWSSYKWCMGENTTMNKYCSNSEYGYNGFSDTKTVLDPEDDAAHVNLGGKWRMPTYAELNELIMNCTWTWTTVNGVRGNRGTSKKEGFGDRSIFFPAAGGYGSSSQEYGSISLSNVGSIGYVWSSSLYYSEDPSIAWCGYFGVGNVFRYTHHRYEGISVRPVYAE